MSNVLQLRPAPGRTGQRHRGKEDSILDFLTALKLCQDNSKPGNITAELDRKIVEVRKKIEQMRQDLTREEERDIVLKEDMCNDLNR